MRAGRDDLIGQCKVAAERERLPGALPDDLARREHRIGERLARRGPQAPPGIPRTVGTP